MKSHENLYNPQALLEIFFMLRVVKSSYTNPLKDLRHETYFLLQLRKLMKQNLRSPFCRGNPKPMDKARLAFSIVREYPFLKQADGIPCEWVILITVTYRIVTL